ncbi:IS110 family transposase [Arthrobacter sp. H35-D1]|uniref:IS110 family transposase n=1 Tax=Arthrobacter sp. H35-D1 TaxID=3046202 RepID=UPI0024BB8E03|nr:IS110 family transposase [Arthrobacter sp. H35-D1]MDJ0315489.1 IS110 family transposase [Arthrobacter sp. H35-D1]
MDLVHERAVGLDISKGDAKVAIRAPGKRAGTFSTEVTTWGSTTNQILALRDMRLAAKVTTVVMQATSDYWKPFYYLMEGALPVMMVNAKSARNIPGRKADVSDAACLAQLGAHGLLRACFVPPEPIRKLRDMTRARTIAVQDRTREAQWLEKFLESTGIKLSDSVSNLMGASSRAMLSALIGGERDPQKLADLAKGVMRKRISELVEALMGRFQDHRAFIRAMDLARTDSLTQWVNKLTTRIDEAMEPFQTAREFLATIPGVSIVVADVIIAETGADMARFETPGRLASWAGLQRIRRPGQVHQDPPREPLPQRCAGHRRTVHCTPPQEQLPRGPLQETHRAPRQNESHRPPPSPRLQHHPEQPGGSLTHLTFVLGGVDQ